MHIVMIDDSIPFDGYSPARKAMGGAEKAFATLPGALVRAGHRVTVFNKCKHPVMAEGARWQRLEGKRPTDVDAVIAFRKVGLLQTYRSVKKKLLWVTADPSYLAHPANAEVLESVDPTFLFISDSQRQAWSGQGNFAVVPPGVRREYIPEATEPESTEPESTGGEEDALTPKPPVAVLTTHPMHGLDWVLDVWTEIVRPAVPEARLQVFSNALSREAMRNDPAELEDLRNKALRAADAGVVINAPQGDRGMAKELEHARVHLYPGHNKDLACWTLRETQAAGIPAVARDLGGTGDVIGNGQTGYLVPDKAALGNVCVQLLSDDSLHRSMSAEASNPLRRRTWETAAQDILTLLA